MKELTKEQAIQVGLHIRLFVAACGATKRADADAETRRSLCNQLYQHQEKGHLTDTQLVRIFEAAMKLEWLEEFDQRFRAWLQEQTRQQLKLPKPTNRQYA